MSRRRRVERPKPHEREPLPEISPLLSPYRNVGYAREKSEANRRDAEAVNSALGLRRIRGEVVDVNSVDGTVQIRRATSLDPATQAAGPPDEEFYPVVGGALPEIGDWVVGIEDNGGPTILGNRVLAQTLYNQTIMEDAVAVPQRSGLNFRTGFDVVDQSGSDRTAIDLDPSEGPFAGFFNGAYQAGFMSATDYQQLDALPSEGRARRCDTNVTIASDTALDTDPDLILSAGNSEVWEFRMRAFFSGAAGANIKIGWQENITPGFFTWSAWGPSTAASAAPFTPTVYGHQGLADVVNFGTVGTGTWVPIEIFGSFQAGSGSQTLWLMWAQLTSSATNTVRRANGSSLVSWRVA